MILTEREGNGYKVVNQVQEPLPKFGLFYRNKEAGVPADLVPRGFGPPQIWSPADLVPRWFGPPQIWSPRSKSASGSGPPMGDQIC